MTFGQLKDLVSFWNDDQGSGYFTSEIVGAFLNNALKEAQKRLIQAGENWYLKCVQATIITDVQCYFLPYNFLKMHRFDVITQVGTPGNESRQTLSPMTPQELRLLYSQTGVPVGYFLKKDAFQLKPAPDKAYAIELLYSYRVADMVADGDSPDCPEEYHEYIAILATIDCFLKDQRDPSAFLTKKDFYETLMKQNAQQRQVDAPRTVVITDSSSYSDGYY